MWCKVPDALVILLDLIVLPTNEGDVFKCFNLSSGGLPPASSGFGSSAGALYCCLRRGTVCWSACFLSFFGLSAAFGLRLPGVARLVAPVDPLLCAPLVVRLLVYSPTSLSSSSRLSLNALIYEANLLFNYLPNNY